MKHYYYIVHQSSKCVLFMHENKFLVSQIQFGLLDTSVRCISDNVEWIDLLVNMQSCKNIDIGYKVEGLQLYTINLSSWPSVIELYNQVNLRFPLFEVLFNIFNIRSARNQIGYDESHKYLLQYALSNQNCIDEYSSTMSIDKEFVKEEFQLILHSKLEEEFSLFTICEFWKEKINKCYTLDQSNKCMYHLLNNFNKPDLYDV